VGARDLQVVTPCGSVASQWSIERCISIPVYSMLHGNHRRPPAAAAARRCPFAIRRDAIVALQAAGEGLRGPRNTRSSGLIASTRRRHDIWRRKLERRPNGAGRGCPTYLSLSSHDRSDRLPISVSGQQTRR
jgi:hypothetical protein